MNTILHLGLGAFHRAHQAAYLQALHDSGDTSWRMVSANIRPDAQDPAPGLRAQACRYTLETVSPNGGRRYATISALSDAIPYAPGLREVVALGADSNTRIISFTVTEAAYFLDDDGRLDLSAGELQQALADAQAGFPGTNIYSVLTAILRERTAPVTLLCCDNLRHNGRRVQRGLQHFLALLGDSHLTRWVAQNTRVPNTMVDRITPRATPEVCTRVRAATGREDPMAVSCEEYLQWVIEDDFCNGRPAWEHVGAELVAAVEPYEEAKIRILNAAHSAIAWAGALAGYQYIHEALRDPRIHAIAQHYITGAVFDCLRPSPIDLARYRDLVLVRFSSDAMSDTVERVLADSFAKLPGFIVPTIRERIVRGLPLDAVALLPALFLQVLLRWHRGELQTPYHDQARDQQVANAICMARDPVESFCAQRSIWAELADHATLRSAIAKAMAASVPA
ncbi:mannitol dehydrogenase family protein [Pseudoduganella sp. RAF53_2]|uniref:mannitol dehydrogenase family protein n=1 Tax=unclassified Pseudoduganella TaxID=2637179 RepID=UPI003F946604